MHYLHHSAALLALLASQAVYADNISIRVNFTEGKSGTVFTPSALKMDYVFVGDGYTAAEMDKWQADAQTVINGFLADPVFAANRNSMNIRRVDVASNQSGADEIDKGIYKDTAMDGEFGCFGIDRSYLWLSGEWDQSGSLCRDSQISRGSIMTYRAVA